MLFNKGGLTARKWSARYERLPQKQTVHYLFKIIEESCLIIIIYVINSELKY